MKVNIVQCSTRKNFPFDIIARAIRYFQNTNYNHYALEVADGEGMLTYFDSSTAYGVRKRTVGSFLKTYDITHTYSIPKLVTYIDFYDFWAKHEGKDYSLIQLLGLLLKVCNIIRYNPFGKGAKRIICNELVILFLNEFGYTDIKDTDSLDLNDTEEILRRVLYEK